MLTLLTLFRMTCSISLEILTPFVDLPLRNRLFYEL